MDVAALPPLRETIAKHGLDARKRFGQHFLLDLNLTRRIARAAGPLDGITVIEIGPGPGGLTRALLLEGDGGRLDGSDPDREVPLPLRLLEQQDRLVAGQLDPDPDDSKLLHSAAPHLRAGR